MKIAHLILGSFETNCYVLRKAVDETECLIIDTGLEAGPLIDFLQTQKLKPLAVILTHGHADHIGGIAALRAGYPDVKVCIHRLDAGMLTSGVQKNISFLAGHPPRPEPPDIIIENQQTLEFAGMTFQVLHTPGHTPGGICLYSPSDRIVFTGDSLFAGSVGRTDLPGGNSRQLIASIKQKLVCLPDRTVTYPGHGPVTTIKKERTTNPFLQ